MVKICTIKVGCNVVIVCDHVALQYIAFKEYQGYYQNLGQDKECSLPGFANLCMCFDSALLHYRRLVNIQTLKSKKETTKDIMMVIVGIYD